MDQQFVQRDEGAERGARRAEAHAAAGDGVEYPAGHHDHDAGRRLDVGNEPVTSALDVLAAQPAAAKGMPWIVHDHIVPDMGRMIG